MNRQSHDPGRLSRRREFLQSTGALAAGAVLAGAGAQGQAAAAGPEALALNGGTKAVTARSATRWPIYGQEEEQAVMALLRSPGYDALAQFEKAWSEFHKTPLCKAHCNGTSALTAMMFALDLPPGSEVLIPDYSTW